MGSKRTRPGRLRRSRIYRSISEKTGLSAKLTLAYSGTVALVVTVIGLLFYLAVESFTERTSRLLAVDRAESIAEFLEYAALLENDTSLRARTESAQSFIDGIFRPPEGGGQSSALEDALSRAERYLRSQKIGDSGYFYALTKDGIVRYHPDEELIGEDVSNEDFIRDILSDESGFVTYFWAREKETREQSKTAYAEWNSELELYLVASDYSAGLFDRIPHKRLSGILESMQDSEIPAIALWNESGELLAASSGYREFQSLMEPPAENTGESGEWSVTTYPRHHLVRYALEPYGIVVELLRDRTRKFNFVRILRYYIFILIAACIIAVAVTSRIAAKSITSPLRRIITFLSRGVLSETDTVLPGKRDSLNRLILLQNKLIYQHRREQRIRKEAEYRLLIAESAFLNTNEGICVTDSDGTILRVNPAFERITGYPEEELVGRNPRILKSRRHSDEFYTEMWKQITTTGSWSGEIWNRTKFGAVYPELLSINRINNERANVDAFVGVFHDIKELSAIQDRIRHVANHDGLTGLPNRSYLDAVLDHAVSRGDREERRLALMFIDIDNFKDVNDSLGHTVGDQLLQWVADTISTLLRKDDLVARFGGDEFVVVLDDVNNQDEVAAVARKILAAVNQSQTIGEQAVHPSVCIGIAIFPDSADNAESLLRNADAAMYEAKNGEKNDYRFHDPEMNVQAHHRLAMQGRIQTAIESGDMTPLFQPIYSLSKKRIVGAEALIRWHHGGTLVPPGRFLPYIENTSTITMLDLWIAENALSEVVRSRILPEDFYLSVNAAPIDLTTPGFAPLFLAAVERAGGVPNRVRLEITETAAVRDYKLVNKTLSALRDAGVQIYIDDFGEGHSSIKYMRDFGVNAVKLDQSYARTLEDSEETQSLIRGFIQLAHGIGIEAIIEGVEEESQLRFLEDAGADYIQGYYFGAPMPLRELEHELERKLGEMRRE